MRAGKECCLRDGGDNGGSRGAGMTDRVEAARCPFINFALDNERRKEGDAASASLSSIRQARPQMLLYVR